MSTSFLSNSSTTYGSHQQRPRCMLSLLLVEVLGGADSNAFWITSGTCIPGASARPLPKRHLAPQFDCPQNTKSNAPEKILIVSMPDREISVEPLGGLGVVGREGIGVTDLEMTPFSFVSLPSMRSDNRISNSCAIRTKVDYGFTFWCQLGGEHGGGRMGDGTGQG